MIMYPFIHLLQIVDELKTVQTMVNDRPSTSDVGNMLDSISHTFKK